MTAVGGRRPLLRPEQVAQVERLAAAGLAPQAIAGMLEVDRATLLRSFRQSEPAPPSLAELDPLGFVDVEPVPYTTRQPVPHP